MNELTRIDSNTQPLIDAVLAGVSSAHSRRAYERHLTDFLTWHEQQGRPALNKAVVVGYRAHLESEGKGAPTINQALCAIRKLIREAADNGAIDPAIAQGVANVKGVRAETLPAGRDIKPGELHALMTVCSNDPSPAGARDAAILALLYTCGLRRAELVSLNREDFDADSGELRILHAKGKKQRKAYVTNGARAAMADWLTIRGDQAGPLFYPIRRGGNVKPGRLTTQAIYVILQNRAEQAGVAELSPHDFRRTFVGDLLDAGADIATVQQMAGHASVTTTARYDRRGEEAKRKAAGLLHIPYRGRGLGL